MLIELDPVDRLTAGAVGEPGQRVFYLQARGSDRLVTLLVEKQQVELLSASLLEVLSRSGRATEGGPEGAEMDLEEPVVPEWRAGRLSIGYDEDRDLVLLEAEEYVAEPAEGDPVPDEPGRARFWATREQALGLARHGAEVCAAGRPRCELCGNPMDPEGHVCPALDGHRGWEG
ncbi:MAG TPA: DUF3090 domain-containing protein [Actinomycetota bacterium]|nr:DUF3090 domain-containing protein [Actinomycetota bacterium]